MTIMHPKYKVVSLLFAVDNAPSPFRIISDIEHYFAQEGCIVSLKAFCGDLFICTLCDEKTVNRARSQNTFFIDNKLCRYKEVETNITCIAIHLPQWSPNPDEITRSLRTYGAIMVNDILTTDAKRYYAVIDLKRDIPSRIKIRNSFLDVIEIV